MRAEAVDDHLSADRYEDRPGQPAPAAAARITSRGVIISGPPHCTPQRPPPTVALLMDPGPHFHAASVSMHERSERSIHVVICSPKNKPKRTIRVTTIPDDASAFRPFVCPYVAIPWTCPP